jgi:hypothetical protein
MPPKGTPAKKSAKQATSGKKKAAPSQKAAVGTKHTPAPQAVKASMMVAAEKQLAKLKNDARVLEAGMASAMSDLAAEKADHHQEARRREREAAIAQRERRDLMESLDENKALKARLAAVEQELASEKFDRATSERAAAVASDLKLAESAAVAAVNTFMSFAFAGKWTRVSRFPACFPKRVAAFARGVKSSCDMTLEQFFADETNYQVVMHGSSVAGRLMCEGFDPACRRRQAHGVGEYFTADFDTAAEYAAEIRFGTCTAVVVAIAIRRECSRTQNYFIVDNPKSTARTYCLPVAAVTMQGYDELPPCTRCRGKSQVLQFVGDDGCWENMSTELGKTVFRRRLEGTYSVRARNWTYSYDWEAMTQTNSQTGKVRCFRIAP